VTSEVLVDGAWRPADASEWFQAVDPAKGEPFGDRFPISRRSDVSDAIDAGARAAPELTAAGDDARARFLELFAAKIEADAAAIVEIAARETAFPAQPRLANVELPRTTDQLRQAAAAIRDGSWVHAVIDTRLKIRSMYGPLGAPVVVFGPNNFPLAFNGVGGGDFAAAIAAGNPVIAKANTGHPGTSRQLALAAFDAIHESGLPAATLQLLYRIDHADGAWLVSHPAIGATAYTGSRAAGLELKRAADAAGKPIYLELSSVNPVYILDGALEERGAKILDEFVTSALMGTGQFCTNPGVVVVPEGAAGRRFIEGVQARYESQAPGALLGPGPAKRLTESVEALVAAGAKLVTGGHRVPGAGCRVENTLLETSGEHFLADPEGLQREAFGNASLVVVARDEDEMVRIAMSFEGNLTGSIYSSTTGSDDGLYARIEEHLRPRVGRLINDKMPTGVAVSPAMNHGGPFPATGHPGFTAVGIPASIVRFAQLRCYDNVREHRLPPALWNSNPTGKLWRCIDGRWTTDDVIETR
jgi:alpha-ketoglutaric semialdehyde dehydrogenase